MFKAHYPPRGRAAAEVGGTAVPWGVTLTPRNHGPITDIPPVNTHGHEGAGRRTAFPSPPAPHAHPGAGSTPYSANPKGVLSGRSPPPGTEEGSYGHPGRCHSPAIGHLSSLTNRCRLPQVSFPAQSHLSHTTGKPTCLPWPKPALPTGDRACTHAYKYIYICIFAYICGDGTNFFFKQSVHKCH